MNIFEKAVSKKNATNVEGCIIEKDIKP